MERLASLSQKLGGPGSKALWIAALREGIEVSRRQVQDFVAAQSETQIFKQAPGSKGKTAVRDEKDSLQVDLIDLKQLPSGPFNYLSLIHI